MKSATAALTMLLAFLPGVHAATVYAPETTVDGSLEIVVELEVPADDLQIALDSGETATRTDAEAGIHRLQLTGVPDGTRIYTVTLQRDNATTRIAGVVSAYNLEAVLLREIQGVLGGVSAVGDEVLALQEAVARVEKDVHAIEIPTDYARQDDLGALLSRQEYALHQEQLRAEVAAMEERQATRFGEAEEHVEGLESSVQYVVVLLVFAVFLVAWLLLRSRNQVLTVEERILLRAVVHRLQITESSTAYQEALRDVGVPGKPKRPARPRDEARFRILRARPLTRQDELQSEEED